MIIWLTLVGTLVGFVAGFGTCWLFKNRAISSLEKERDQLKRSAVAFINRF
jgi:hypothetical protein